MKYFDQHCHLDDSKFDENREETIKAIYDFGTKYFGLRNYDTQGNRVNVFFEDADKCLEI